MSDRLTPESAIEFAAALGPPNPYEEARALRSALSLLRAQTSQTGIRRAQATALDLAQRARRCDDDLHAHYHDILRTAAELCRGNR